jgi:hypothetical protein
VDEWVEEERLCFPGREEEEACSASRFEEEDDEDEERDFRLPPLERFDLASSPINERGWGKK